MLTIACKIKASPENNVYLYLGRLGAHPIQGEPDFHASEKDALGFARWGTARDTAIALSNRHPFMRFVICDSCANGLETYQAGQQIA